MIWGVKRVFHAVALLVALGSLVSCAAKCYGERFCRELMGQAPEEVIALVGTPTRSSSSAGVQTLEWAYDGTYSRLVPGFYDPWWGCCHPRPFFAPAMPPYMELETVPRVAMMRINFVKNKAVSYNTYFCGAGMCNFFVPPPLISRYREEDKNRKDASPVQK